MRIFISHASKNGEIVLKFAELLEKVSCEIEVFCSFERGTIGAGQNFVEKIFDELNNSDLFIPIISREYFESKFCMIELGVAFSYLYNRYKNEGENYIFPFALYPIQKGQALSGTPIANLQVGSINEKEDIHSFLECLSNDKGIYIGSGINQKIHSFIYEVEQVVMKTQNVIETAKIKTFFDNSIEFRNPGDVVSNSIAENMIVVNYNMNPYDRDSLKKPNFISLVLKYVDKFDLRKYLNFNNQAEFVFTVNDFSDSLKRIFVEFKYSDSNVILDTFEFPIEYGENKLKIPLERMDSKALSNISEICFVIHPGDVKEEEGMFKVGEIMIRC